MNSIYNQALCYLKNKYSNKELKPLLNGVGFNSSYLPSLQDTKLTLLLRQFVVSEIAK